MGDIVPHAQTSGAIVVQKAFDAEQELADYEKRLKEVGGKGFIHAASPRQVGGEDAAAASSSHFLGPHCMSV
jgi:hypothetical protein